MASIMLFLDMLCSIISAFDRKVRSLQLRLRKIEGFIAFSLIIAHASVDVVGIAQISRQRWLSGLSFLLVSKHVVSPFLPGCQDTIFESDAILFIILFA